MTLTMEQLNTITPEMMQQVMADVHAANPHDRSALVMSARDRMIFVHVLPTNTTAVIEYDRATDLYEMTLAKPGQPLRDMHVAIGMIGQEIFGGEISRHPDFRVVNVCSTFAKEGA